jgi:competence protein ComGC
MKIASSKKALGLTLFELLIVVAILLLLAAIILPALAKAKARSSHISCVNQLKQVGLAFRVWEGDNGDKFPMSVSVTNGGTMELVESGAVFPHFQVMSNELNSPKILICPNDKRRHSATNFTSDFNDSRLSYFIGVDAAETNSTMLLAGDRNLTLNKTALKQGLIKLRFGDAVGWTGEIHVNVGNVLMAEGSVQQLSQSGLEEALKITGATTNRLAVP